MRDITKHYSNDAAVTPAMKDAGKKAILIQGLAVLSAEECEIIFKAMIKEALREAV
jgi:hypothetical protein